MAAKFSRFVAKAIVKFNDNTHTRTETDSKFVLPSPLSKEVEQKNERKYAIRKAIRIIDGDGFNDRLHFANSHTNHRSWIPETTV